MPRVYRTQPGRTWTEQDHAFLACHWGLQPDAWIAARIPSGPRTVTALVQRAKRFLRQARLENVLTASEVGRVFGVNPNTVVRRWLREGLVMASHAGFSRGGHHVWNVSTDSLRRFVVERPWAYSLARMELGHWLTELAHQTQGDDPYITLAEAGELLHYTPGALWEWVVSGRLSAQRRPNYGRRGGDPTGCYVVRRRGVEAVAARLTREEPERSARASARISVLAALDRATRSGEPSGLYCAVCGDEVPFPQKRYCGTACRRRAQAVAVRRRRTAA